MATVDKIAAVIPAYNETRYITSVLSAFHDVDIISDIIVDDGSSGTTVEKVQAAIVSDKRIRLIQHTINLGKGQAILTGRKATKAPVLPHPSDQHPDHGAVSNFARMAIAMTARKDGKYRP